MSGSSSFEVFSRFLELLKVKEVADTDDEEANIALVADLVLSFFSARPNEQQGVLQVPPKTKEQGKRINGRGRTISRAATRATRAKERMKNKGNENGK